MSVPRARYVALLFALPYASAQSAGPCLTNTSIPCPPPTWEPQWNLTLSTIVNPGIPGWFEPLPSQPWGLVSLDWQSARSVSPLLSLPLHPLFFPPFLLLPALLPRMGLKALSCRAPTCAPLTPLPSTPPMTCTHTPISPRCGAKTTRCMPRWRPRPARAAGASRRPPLEPVASFTTTLSSRFLF